MGPPGRDPALAPAPKSNSIYVVTGEISLMLRALSSIPFPGKKKPAVAGRALRRMVSWAFIFSDDSENGIEANIVPEGLDVVIGDVVFELGIGGFDFLEVVAGEVVKHQVMIDIRIIGPDLAGFAEFFVGILVFSIGEIQLAQLEIGTEIIFIAFEGALIGVDGGAFVVVSEMNLGHINVSCHRFAVDFERVLEHIPGRRGSVLRQVNFTRADQIAFRV